MKLLFSEANPDYSHYLFRYAVWAIAEEGEHPSTFYDLGFFPSSTQQSKRYFMCRGLRADLNVFKLTSENRRILRKCTNITCRIVPREEFSLTEGWINFCVDYFDTRFGSSIMTRERLLNHFDRGWVTHILVFHDRINNKDVGIVTLYLCEPTLAHYQSAFYDVNYRNQNLGLFMMTHALSLMASKGVNFLYLGSVYESTARYKLQFTGLQFFNGFTWSNDIKELKYLLHRDQVVSTTHLLETDSYVNNYLDGSIELAAEQSPFRLCK